MKQGLAPSAPPPTFLNVGFLTSSFNGAAMAAFSFVYCQASLEQQCRSFSGHYSDLLFHCRKAGSSCFADSNNGAQIFTPALLELWTFHKHCSSIQFVICVHTAVGFPKSYTRKLDLELVVVSLSAWPNPPLRPQSRYHTHRTTLVHGSGTGLTPAYAETLEWTLTWRDGNVIRWGARMVWY